MFLEWRLRKIRVKEEKKLTNTNLYLYKSITKYIQNSSLRGIEKEEILHQLLDMMLQAQNENKPINTIIGNDYEEFCQSIIKEYTEGRSTAYRLLSNIQTYLIWLLIISAIMILLRKLLNPLFDLGITIDQFILANIISLIIVPISKKNSQETSYLTSFYQRFYTMNKGLSKSATYALILSTLILVALRYVLTKTLGSEVFNFTITLLASVPYIIITLLIIGGIQIYKRFCEKAS